MPDANTPGIADLKRLFYGGDSDAEIQFLKDAAAEGISAGDLLELVGGGGGGVTDHGALTGLTDADHTIAAVTGLQAALDAKVATAQAVNAQTGTTYSLVAGDAGKLVTLSNAGAITLTLPQDSDATIAIGTYVDLYALGAGQVTAVAGSGATLRTSGLTAKSRAQYARFGVQKVSANTWSLFGDLAAS